MGANKFFGLETSACVHRESLLMTMFHQIKISQILEKKTELLCYVAYRLSEGEGRAGGGSKINNFMY